MLFNSYEYIFIFLPISTLTFFAFAHAFGFKQALLWLCICSFGFYAFWRYNNLLVLALSILFNYSISFYVSGVRTIPLISRRTAFITSISTNLLLLCYYKYIGFFTEIVNDTFGTSLPVVGIILPLAISFFTFTQIAYQADAYRQTYVDRNFMSYTLFVTYFPHLIAGPIVHHSELMPQFALRSIFRPDIRNIVMGISLFIIGIFKKVCLADTISEYANPVFNAAELGTRLSFFEAWGGALAYTFQIYFDFSGYCDMAMGSAAVLGIWLPLNFNSPYRATSIIDFWRRWHMTLSRFLRDYLYISLGGNRLGEARRYLNLMLTMLLGGLWHGAGWTFVAWGALHGVLLSINHGWVSLVGGGPLQPPIFRRAWVVLCWSSTLLCVIIAWVFFRANSFSGALAVLEGMAGVNGALLDHRLAPWLSFLHPLVDFTGRGIGKFGSPWGYVFLFALAIIAIFPYNSWQIVGYAAEDIRYKGARTPLLRAYLPLMRSPAIALLCGVFGGLLFASAILRMTSVNQFLYFTF